MRPDDVLAYVRHAPFRPFRIFLTDGTAYEIRHPELIKVERSSALIFFHRQNDPRQMVLRHDSVALIHINRMEHIDAEAPQTTPSSESNN